VAVQSRTMKNWKRNTILFLVSQSVTLFGTTVVQMAVIWFVTKQTSSGKWVALFTVCSYLPQFLISFAGGVWADRYDRKRIIIGTDVAIAVVTFWMFIVMPYIAGAAYQNVLLTALLALAVVRSLGCGIQTPAVNAVLPTLVPPEKLMRFNGINATFQAVMQFASPAAAGVLLSYSSMRYALLADVVTAAAGISMCLFVVIPHLLYQGNAAGAGEHFFTGVKKGVQYAASSSVLVPVLASYGLFIFLSVPAGFLAQLYVTRTYGTTYWYMTAVELAGFFGMTGGGILMSTWGGFKNSLKTFTVGLVVFGLLGGALGFSPNFIVYLGCMLVYGIALTVIQTAATTLLQEHTEEAMQGRVFGLLGSVYSFCLPAGMTVFGPLADVVPLKILMAVSGVLLVVAAGVADRSVVS
jgi:MFS transporter, DHA3 family, macrolide efflux protein